MVAAWQFDTMTILLFVSELKPFPIWQFLSPDLSTGGAPMDINIARVGYNVEITPTHCRGVMQYQNSSGMPRPQKLCHKMSQKVSK